MALIELTDIGKIYGLGDATTIALDNINLKIDKGEFIAIMGPSGSGKSTLMNIIGLLDTPSFGGYHLESKPVANLSSNARAKIRRDKIGFVFQSFNLLPRMRVIENVALPLMYSGVDHVESLERASKVLDSLDMKNREYYHLNQLSGGQIQRVAIARALVNKPSIILADEPTGNLDTKSGLMIMDLLSEVHSKGNTVIMVTHDERLSKYAERMVHVIDGRISDISMPIKKNKSKVEKPKTKKKTKRKKTSKKRGKK